MSGHCKICGDTGCNGESHFIDEKNIDVEAELAKILQKEIWKELEKETGKTKKDLDNEIIQKIIDLYKSKND